MHRKKTMESNNKITKFNLVAFLIYMFDKNYLISMQLKLKFLIG